LTYPPDIPKGLFRDDEGFLKAVKDYDENGLPRRPSVDPYDLTGKACTAVSARDGFKGECGHPAFTVWSWAPGHLDGYRCVCCVRRAWEESSANLKKELDSLPSGCSAQSEGQSGMEETDD
jgi:hypothetical protein